MATMANRLGRSYPRTGLTCLLRRRAAVCPSMRISIKDDHCPALDGVRGLAFVLVVLCHANDYLSRPFFLADGQIGVWIFFVLSSFLLAKPFFAAPASLLGFSTWWRYAARRFLRIYPLFFVYVLGLWFFAHVPTAKCLRVFALERTHAVDWSLYVEFRFYAILPVLVLPLAWGLGRRAYFGFLIAATAAIVGLFPFWAHYRGWPFGGVTMSGWAGNGVFLGYLSCFLPGVIAAYASAHASVGRRTSGLLADGLGVLVLVSLLSIPLLRQPGMPGQNVDYGVFLHLWFPYAVLFAVWIYLLSVSEGVFARILSSRPFRYLGDISYPGYLCHIFVFFGIRPLFPEDNVAFLVVSLVTLLVLSHLLHVVVEVPLYRLRPKAQRLA